jgi:hypothetical protein
LTRTILESKFRHLRARESGSSSIQAWCNLYAAQANYSGAGVHSIGTRAYTVPVSTRILACVLALGLLWGNSGAVARDPPEVTEDGLVRVPSTAKAGVYRAPGVPFAHYRRVIIGPTIPMQFRRGWERTHREITPQDLEDLRADFVRAFRVELENELVKRGGFAVASEPARDVIRVDASVTDLDLAAPAAGIAPSSRTFTRSAGSMKVTVELRDAASGVLIGRIIDYEKAREFLDPQPATQVSNLEEFRIGFANAARYVREAINVAKTERPPP